MNKVELVANVSQKVNSTKKQADEFVTAVLDVIQETLGKHENIKLVGFGNWEIKKKDARKGRNPKTGEEIQIKEKVVVKFKPSKQMKEIVMGD